MLFSRVFLGLILLLLVACQPVPRPFSHNGTPDNVLLDLPDHVGVVVLPVAEAPPATADALAHAMVEALHAANVPATTNGGARASRFLQGRIEDDGKNAGLIWELFTPDGTLMGESRQSIEGTPIPAWQAAESSLMRDLAWVAAAPIAALLQPQTAYRPTPLFLSGVTVHGAPGNGDTQLRRAIQAALETRGVTFGAPATGHPSLQGIVELTPAHGGLQQVRITWQVIDANSVERGVIAQENQVPAGSLNDTWQAVAPLIAVAANPGIIEVLNKAGGLDQKE